MKNCWPKKFHICEFSPYNLTWENTFVFLMFSALFGKLSQVLVLCIQNCVKERCIYMTVMTLLEGSY